MKLNISNPILSYTFAVLAVALSTAVLILLENHINPVTVALIFLLVILFLATAFGSKPAIFGSILAMLSFNYFFLPPIGTFTVSDPENWVALITFFIVAITAGQLSIKAKQRAEEAEWLYAELQNAFEKASQAEALKRSEKLKSALLDAVTHDLRTPLTSIKASVTMLIEESFDSTHLSLEKEGRAELLEVIDEETDRLNDFIESMVEVAKIEAGDFHLRKTSVKIEDVILTALERAANLTANHNIIKNIQKNSTEIFVDAKAISEVIYNLLENAAKYSPAQTAIKISARQIEDYVEIVVEDEGKIILPAERDKIFEKFYRADKSKKGFGMGLAIARGIIESHNGRIWVESGKNGNRFVIELTIKSDG